MTKEQIAYKETNFIFDEHELGITGLANAMDIYAKQQAIGFTKWYLRSEWNGFKKSDSDERKTMEEIYELYLKTNP